MLGITHQVQQTQPRLSNQTLLSRGIPIISPRTWEWMVEARRVELLSENKSAQLSTSVVCLLISPRTTDKQDHTRVAS